jgi:hypothetical protein
MKSYKSHIIFSVSLLFSLTSCVNKNTNADLPRKTPLLIIAQRPTPAGYPAVIANHLDYIESLPFDGMFINSVSGWNLMNGQPVSYDSIYSEFSVLKGAFKKFKNNFISVFIYYPGDLWDDKAWGITAQNFANIAKVARTLGFKGIIFDNEEYRSPKWLNYGQDYRNPKYDLQQHGNKASQRGKEIMEAMIAVYPEIEVMHMHGPYLSEPNYRIPKVNLEQAGSWDNQELMGPFFVGMVLGKGPNASVIDGGEQYQYRTEKDFKDSYDLRKYEIASEETNSWFIPVSLRRIWPNQVEISFGVYNKMWIPKYPMNPEIMKSTLINALKNTDRFVWYYTEEESWLEPGKMPKEWIDMVIGVMKCKSGF